MSEYTIIIEKAECNYSAFCPTLLGCIATGSSIEETIERMKEAIKFHIEGLKEENIKIAVPFTKVVSVEVAV